MPDSRRKSRSMNMHPGHCHLCGLAIPDFIVHPEHPLFGTIDHVVPLSIGGANIASNRAPAHRICNQRKGSAISLPDEVVWSLQLAVVKLLKKVNVKIKKSGMKAALNRVGLVAPEGWL